MVTAFIYLLGAFIVSVIVLIVAMDRLEKKGWRYTAWACMLTAFVCFVGILSVLCISNFFIEPKLPIG